MGVRQAYGDLVVYEDLNLEIEKQQRIVLVGPNGAGISTLLKILGGIISIEGGTCELGHQSKDAARRAPRVTELRMRPERGCYGRDSLSFPEGQYWAHEILDGGPPPC